MCSPQTVQVSYRSVRIVFWDKASSREWWYNSSKISSTSTGYRRRKMMMMTTVSLPPWLMRAICAQSLKITCSSVRVGHLNISTSPWWRRWVQSSWHHNSSSDLKKRLSHWFQRCSNDRWLMTALSEETVMTATMTWVGRLSRLKTLTKK